MFGISFSFDKYKHFENLSLGDTMIQMDGGDRLRVTLLDRMSTVENGRSSVTLEDVLMADTSASRPQPSPPPPSHITPPSPARNRSLLDVMRRDRRRDKTAWKFLRDKLRLKRTSTTTTAWISSNLIPYLDTPISTPDDNDSHRRINRLGFLLSNSETNGNREAEREGRLLLSTVLAEDREPPRMSLMELLEDNDGPMTMYDVSKRGEAEEVTTAMVASAESGGCCCVCMIRSKGAAFIPCGHTFCRLCCRQLLVQRGICPLCNTSIIQVLDIF